MGTQQFFLKWNNHQSNLINVFDHLLTNEALVDVTLVCEGLSLKAHKIILSACSPFFQTLFLENPCKHPIVIMKDMKYAELKAVIDFMYKGEVNISYHQLPGLLKIAEILNIKGLIEVADETEKTIKNQIKHNLSNENKSIPLVPLKHDHMTLYQINKKRKWRRKTFNSSCSDSEIAHCENQDSVESIEEILPESSSSLHKHFTLSGCEVLPSQKKYSSEHQLNMCITNNETSTECEKNFAEHSNLLDSIDITENKYILQESIQDQTSTQIENLMTNRPIEYIHPNPNENEELVIYSAPETSTSNSISDILDIKPILTFEEQENPSHTLQEKNDIIKSDSMNSLPDPSYQNRQLMELENLQDPSKTCDDSEMKDGTSWKNFCDDIGGMCSGKGDKTTCVCKEPAEYVPKIEKCIGKKRKIEILTLETRIKVIKESASGATLRQLAEKFNCGKTQIFNILQKRDYWLKEWEMNKNNNYKTKRKQPNEEVNNIGISSNKGKKRKNEILTLETRIKVINESASGATLRQLAEKFNCGKTQIFNILQKRDYWLKEWEMNKNNNYKRKRKQPNEEVNKFVWDWFQEARDKHIPISGPLIQEKAREFAEHLKISSFRASNGWLDSFRRRHNIVFGSVGGEKRQFTAS